MKSNQHELHSQVKIFISENVEPYVASHGGEIVVEKIEGDCVYVSLRGVCDTCTARDITLKATIERALRKQFVEINSAVLL